MKRCFLSLILLFLLAVPVQAEACYSEREVGAENALRLHSEMMVVAVTCRQTSQGRDLVKAHTQFTKKHIDTIKEAEAVMIAFYKDSHGGDGLAQLDALRTKLANEFGQMSADETPPTFCHHRRDKIMVLYDSPSLRLFETGMTLYAGAPSYAPVCNEDNVAKIAQKSKGLRARKPS
ncbi:MAG: hypothetical protein FWF24_03135 [Alphaproteobacteria bacterium]|nr:hypothetical protein [Alphaproteobacteria bacterium]